MNLSSPSTIKQLCRDYKISPQKHRGQNFLVDKNILDKIIKLAGVKKDDIILEVGPGFGTLTEELARKAKRVVAVELDKRLFQSLRDNLAGYKNVELVNEDIFQFPISPSTPSSGPRGNFQLQDSKYRLIANLPYSITSAVINKFLTPISRSPLTRGACPAYAGDRGVGKEETRTLLTLQTGRRENPPSSANRFGHPLLQRGIKTPRPKDIIILVQQEVAERIMAGPGEMNLLAIAVQVYGRPQALMKVRPGSFWPRPKVNSLLLKIDVGKGYFYQEKNINKELFWRIVRFGFSSKRKQLVNNLSKNLSLPKEEVKKWLKQAKIDPEIRAEELALSDWARLTNQAPF